MKAKKLTEEEVWIILVQFLKEISTRPTRPIVTKYKTVIYDLAKKLRGVFRTEKEIVEYLDHILEHMDNLNKFFKRNRKGSVPFSMIFVFANKDERLSSFLMEKNFSKKNEGKHYDEMAGFESSEQEKSLEPDSFSVYFKKIRYDFLVASGVNLFFFSPKKQKMAVQLENGKMVSFNDYLKAKKKKKLKPIGRLKLFKKICGKKEKTKTEKLFCSYVLEFKERRKKEKEDAR